MQLPFLILLLASCEFGRDRLVSHVASPTDGFASTVVLANGGESADETELIGFERDGVPSAPVSRIVGGGETKAVSIPDLFGTNDVSHFNILESDEVHVTITYDATSGSGSLVHVPESAASAMDGQPRANEYKIHLTTERS